MKRLLLLAAAIAVPLCVSAHEEKTDNSWWWDNAWWNEGKLEAPKTYEVETRWIDYKNGEIEVPALVARP